MHLFKIVFHIDEMNKWELALGNVSNFIEDIGNAEYFIEIVANAAAVKLFATTNDSATSELVREMEGLVKQGIKIAVCKNALRANAIPETVLPDYVTVVPAGITKLVMLQEQGYCYIKP